MVKFNNVEIKTKDFDGVEYYNRIDAGRAIGYRNPHMLGRNCFGSQQYITKAQLINVLWRSSYQTATYLVDVLVAAAKTEQPAEAQPTEQPAAAQPTEQPTAAQPAEAAEQPQQHVHNMAKVRSDFLNLKHLAMDGYGKTEEEAINIAHNFLRKEVGVEVLDMFIRCEEKSLTPAEIGNEVKLPEEKVNLILSKLNYQVPVNGHFVPTLKGQAFAVMQNHNIIFWHPGVLAEMREVLN